MNEDEFANKIAVVMGGIVISIFIIAALVLIYTEPVIIIGFGVLAVIAKLGGIHRIADES